MRSLGWALIQRDSLPETGDSHTGTHKKTMQRLEGKGPHLQAQERVCNASSVLAALRRGQA